MIRIALTTNDPQLIQLIQTLDPNEFEWIVLKDIKKTAQHTFDICICDEKTSSDLSKYALGKFAIVIWRREVEEAHKAFQHAKETQALTVISHQDGRHLNSILRGVYEKFMSEHLKHVTEGKSILVCSSKGGVGKTFLSLHLAKQIATLSKQKVLYIDLGGSFRSTQPWISIDSDQSWETVRLLLSQPDNLQARQLLGIIVNHSEGFHILPAPNALRMPLSVVEVENLVNIAKQVADYVIVDFEGIKSKEDVKVAQKFDSILLVSTPDISSTLHTNQLLSSMKVDLENEITFILNQYDSTHHQEEKRAIEKHTETEIVHTIEHDSDAVLHYQIQGKLIDDSSLIVVDNIRHLADEMMKP